MEAEVKAKFRQEVMVKKLEARVMALVAAVMVLPDPVTVPARALAREII